MDDDELTWEQDADNQTLGQRMRARRQELALSLRELAETTGLSAAFLSGLERGNGNPTLASVRRIAMALKVPIYRLLADSREEGMVVRHDLRPHVRLPASKLTYQVLTPQLTRRMVVVQLELAPQTGNIVNQPLLEPGDEFILVQTGRLEVRVSGQSYELEAGDSMYFDNHYVESIRALGNDVATVITAWARSD